MKKIILNILMLCGLLIASEKDANKLNQQYAPTVEYNTKLIYEKIKNNVVDVEKKFDSVPSPLSYIIDEDMNINVKLNFNLAGFDNITIKELKELIANIKNEDAVNKILLDVEASTVNDFKENLLLKKELDFEKKKAKDILVETEKSNNILLESQKEVKNLKATIKETGTYLLILFFSLGIVVTLYIQSEIDSFKMKREKEQLPILHYVLIYGIKLFIAVVLIIVVIQFLK